MDPGLRRDDGIQDEWQMVEGVILERVSAAKSEDDDRGLGSAAGRERDRATARAPPSRSWPAQRAEQPA
jgi:hypothetical protein